MEGIFAALDLVAEREEDIFFIWCDVGEYSTRHRKTRKRGKGRWKRLIYIQNDITYHRMSHYSRKEEELDIYFFQSKHNIKADRQD